MEYIAFVLMYISAVFFAMTALLCIINITNKKEIVIGASLGITFLLLSGTSECIYKIIKAANVYLQAHGVDVK